MWCCVIMGFTYTRKTGSSITLKQSVAAKPVVYGRNWITSGYDKGQNMS